MKRLYIILAIPFIVLVVVPLVLMLAIIIKLSGDDLGDTLYRGECHIVNTSD